MTQPTITNPPQIRKPLPRHIPRYCDFSHAKQAHIAGLLAALRRAVADARREALTEALDE